LGRRTNITKYSLSLQALKLKGEIITSKQAINASERYENKKEVAIATSFKIYIFMN
jgi:hypothetical protein